MAQVPEALGHSVSVCVIWRFPDLPLILITKVPAPFSWPLTEYGAVEGLRLRGVESFNGHHVR